MPFKRLFNAVASRELVERLSQTTLFRTLAEHAHDAVQSSTGKPKPIRPRSLEQAGFLSTFIDVAKEEFFDDKKKGDSESKDGGRSSSDSSAASKRIK